MLSYEKGLAIVLERLQPLPGKMVPVDSAAGLVLAEPVAARWDLPGHNNSAMDGFAFAADSISAGKPIDVVGFLPAGKLIAEPVPPGCAVRIMTGAPLPPGTDTVVPVEKVEIDGEVIVLQSKPATGADVRLRGEEFKSGETLLEPGTLLRSGEIGLLSAAGVESVLVHPKPRVAFLVTGDELVELGEEPVDGKIINSNLYMISTRLREEAYDIIELGTVGDQPDLLAERLAQGFSADLVMTTGGVSIGDHDFIHGLCDRLEMSIHFWKLAIKPGKPVLFATRTSIPFFGLPGNPAAAAATYEILVRPALHRLAGHPHPEPPKVPARLIGPVVNKGQREHFIWGTVATGETGLTFTPSPWQASGQCRTMQGFNSLLPIPAGEQLADGTSVHPMLVRMPD